MSEIAHVSAKHKVFVLPYDQRIIQMVPSSRSAATAGGPVVVVPHTRDATRFARNLGYKVPAPITSQYDWGATTPFDAQKITAALLTMNERAFVLSEIGTGKTRAAAYALDFMLGTGEIKAALVAAPLSTLVRTWELELFRFFPHLRVEVLYGDRVLRLKRLASGADVYIINHDGIEVVLAELQNNRDIQAVVIDELSYYRNSQNDRWKMMQQFLIDRKYVWGMTGSPVPNEPADAYGQVKLLRPSRVPKYYKHFKEAVMRKVSTFRWVEKPDALDRVYEVMQPAVRFLRRDVKELPETSYQTREVDLTPRQKGVYDVLFKTAVHQFAEGTVTALNEGILLSKLLQISSGWVYTSKRAVVALPNGPRVDALLELLEEGNAKTIVFVGFIHAAAALFNRVRSAGFNAALVTGEVPLGRRNQIFADFQDNPKGARVLVAHPRCMAHGLTLTAADTIIWFTPPDALETYEQANGRITRPGQVNKTLVVHLCASPVERKIYNRIQRRAKLQGALLEMFESNE